jgi:hypothetical protein
MAGRECYHCKQWIEAGEPHNCWTTTEAALTAALSDDLRDAWERLRETAVEFGEQRIYASLNSIMFSRKACYFFVRPKRHYLEVCFFLGRTLKASQVRRAMPASKTKTAHLIHVRHRDEVESPMTDWLQEAYDFSEVDSRRFAGIVARKQVAVGTPEPKTRKKTTRRALLARVPNQLAKKKKAVRKTAKKR